MLKLIVKKDPHEKDSNEKNIRLRVWLMDGPNDLVTYLDFKLVFGWSVVRHGSNNMHQKDTCAKAIGIHTQNI